MFQPDIEQFREKNLNADIELSSEIFGIKFENIDLHFLFWMEFSKERRMLVWRTWDEPVREKNYNVWNDEDDLPNAICL